MNLVMANQPELLNFLYTHLSNGTELIDIEAVRSVVSSPRLMDFAVQNISFTNLAMVGDTFLEKRTMIADAPQRTYGLSLGDWERIKPTVQVVSNFNHADTSVAKLQIWPFDPNTLGEHQAYLAVALSYTYLELYAEPRIVGAINDILGEIGFFIDPERY